jgi:hypothetical protein
MASEGPSMSLPLLLVLTSYETFSELRLAGALGEADDRDAAKRRASVADVGTVLAKGLSLKRQGTKTAS